MIPSHSAHYHPRAPMYKPQLNVVFAPRVPERLRKGVNRICKKHDMARSEVLRYCFEASVLTAPKRLKRLVSGNTEQLDSMLLFRTNIRIRRLVVDLWRNNPNSRQADILRALFEAIIPVAEARGMAYVMKMRELALAKRR